MAFQVTALYDQASGQQPLAWDQLAIADGDFSVDQGRVLIDTVYTDIVSWTPTQVQFIPRKRYGLDDGSFAIHFDNTIFVDFLFPAALQEIPTLQSGAITRSQELLQGDLQEIASLQNAALTQDHVVTVSNLQIIGQVQSGDIVQTPAGGTEYFNDFTDGVPISLGGFVYSRASDSTGFDDIEVLREMVDGDPVFPGAHHAGSGVWEDTGRTLGLQLEADSTNLVPNSDMSDWSGALSNQDAVDSQGRADKAWHLSDTNISSVLSFDSQEITGITATDPYVASVRIKKLTEPADFYPCLQFDGSSGQIQDVKLDAFTGEVIAGSNDDGTYGVIDDGDWWRVWASVLPVFNSAYVYVFPSYAGDMVPLSFASSAIGTIVACDAQLEAGIYPTSFIETTGITATRAVNSLKAALSDLSGMPANTGVNGFCGQYSFLLVRSLDEIYNEGGTRVLFELKGDGSNTIYAYAQSASITYDIIKSGSGVFPGSGDLSALQAGDVLDIRYRQSSVTGFTVWINGAIQSWPAYTADYAMGLSLLSVADYYNGSAPSWVNLVQLSVDTHDLSNAEIEAWPTWISPDAEYLHRFTKGYPITEGGFNHTRASDATGFDDSGVLQTVTTDEPVYPGAAYAGSGVWNNETDIVQGLRLEDTATNTVLNSDLSDWSNVDVVGFQDATDPFGSSLAMRCVDDSGSSIELMQMTDTSGHAVDVDYTFSIYIKKDSDESHFPGFRGVIGSSNARLKLNKNTGAVTTYGTDDTTNYGVTDEGDWWRLWFVLQGSSTLHRLYVYPAAASDMTVGTSDVTAQGETIFSLVQDELGTFPSSYIPTSGATYTRAATLCNGLLSSLDNNLPAAGLVNDFCAQAIFTLKRPFDDLPEFTKFFYLESSDGDNFTEVRSFLSSGYIYVDFRKANVEGGITSQSLAGSPEGTVIDLRLVHRSVGDTSIWVNGVKTSRSDKPGDFPVSLTQATLAANVKASTLRNWVDYELVRIIPHALSDAEIESWPTWTPPSTRQGYFHDFTEDSVLTEGGFAHTRASDATCIDQDGVVQSLTTDQPGYPDAYYIGSGKWGDEGQAKGLQLEAESTNHAKDSEDFSAAAWVDRGGLVSATGNLAPDGSYNAAELNLYSSSTADFFQHIETGISSVACSPSVWVKSLDRNDFEFANSSSSSRGLWDINGSALSGEWERLYENHPAVSVVNSFVTGSSGTVGLHFRELTTTAANILVWGVQLEADTAFPSSYIPTSGATYTRAPTKTGNPLSDLANLPSTLPYNACGQVTFTLMAAPEDQPTDYSRYFDIGIEGFKSGVRGLLFKVDNQVGVEVWSDQDGGRSLKAPADYYSAGDVVDVRWKVEAGVGVTFWYEGIRLFSADVPAIAFLNPPDRVGLGNVSGLAQDWNGNTITHFVNIVPKALSDAEIESWPTWTPPV